MGSGVQTLKHRRLVRAAASGSKASNTSTGAQCVKTGASWTKYDGTTACPF